jgi:hypothetical protein
LKRVCYALLGISLLIGLESGCGSDSGPEMAVPGKLDDAGPNRRLKIKDEYKQAISKDGRLILKPGMKKPDLKTTP